MQELDYRVLKYLYRRKEPIKVGDIAREFSVPHSTVGSCVKRLKNFDYLFYTPYEEVKLSKAGNDLAIELIRHAQLMEVLLYNELKLSIEDAHRESEKINFLFSCVTINKICQKYNHPKTCPCGDEILNSSDCYCKEND